MGLGLAMAQPIFPWFAAIWHCIYMLSNTILFLRRVTKTCGSALVDNPLKLNSLLWQDAHTTGSVFASAPRPFGSTASYQKSRHLPSSRALPDELVVEAIWRQLAAHLVGLLHLGQHLQVWQEEEVMAKQGCKQQYKERREGR